MKRAAAFLAVVMAAHVHAQSWSPVGPAPISWFGGSSGRLSATVASHSDPNLYYVAGADGGVWRTRDGGVTWTALTDHLPASAMGALALDPHNHDIVYAGTGEANFANHSRYGLGLFKSTDGGDTWTQHAEQTFAGRCFSKIVINTQDTNILYAGITRAGGFPEMAAAKLHPQREGPLGVFRSSDGGQTWQHLTNGLPPVTCTDLAIDPQNPTVVYAAIGHIFGSNDNGVYKTTDGGNSWSRLAGGLPTTNVGRISIAISASNPARLYTMVSRVSNSTGGNATVLGGWRTDNAGATWSTIPLPSIQSSYGWYLSCVGVHPTNPDIAVFGGLNAVRTTNGGSTFQTITPPHVDLHAWAWDAAGRLLAGDDGGIHRTSDLGSNWESLNTNISTVQFYAGLSTHPTNPDIIFGGTQDNGTNRKNDSSTLWTTVLGGDGGWTQINQSSPNIVFAESQGTGNLSRSTNGGATFNSSRTGINTGDRNCFLPPYLIVPQNPQTMLYATHRIYRSTNGGTSWTAISGDLTGGTGAVRTLALAPSNPQVVYAATNDGRVLVSTDGGANFTIIRTGHPGWPRVTREITVDPLDPMTAYLAVAAFGGSKVLRTRNAGQTWEDITGDLPDEPVNVVAIDVRGQRPILYAGSDTTVYTSLDDGRHWTRYGGNGSGRLPVAAVIDMILEPSRNRLVIGTQGRGAWTIDTPACYADCDMSTGPGVLDIFDFLCFSNRFANGDPGACNCDISTGFEVCDIFDFLCFSNAFAAECE